MTYSPGFFKSLIKGCYDSQFYAEIKNISFKRSIGFLFLFSILAAVVSCLLLLSYFSRHENFSRTILNAYDTHLPAFQATFRENTLEVVPPDFSLYLSVDQNREMKMQTTVSDSSFFVIEVDTAFSHSEFPEPSLSGIYVLKDALLFSTGIQKSLISYKDLGIPSDITFTKESLRSILEQQLPAILSWVKKITLQIGTALIFFYTFLSSLVLALFSSLYGMAMFLIRRKSIRYLFLLKLSFYATVPASLFMLMTHLLAISVPFLTILVYLCFYSYGLRVYEE